MGRGAVAAPAKRGSGRSAPARRHPAGPGRRRVRHTDGPQRRSPAVRKPIRRASGHARVETVPRPRGARVLDALLTGRACIAVVGVLLAGIVFFNVDLLQMNRDITQMADRASALKRENARLRVDLARLASSERIQETALGLGLVYPAPGEVRYLESRPPIDAKNASKRMSAPDPTYVAPETVATTPDPAATSDPTAAPTTEGADPTDPSVEGETTGPVDPATGLAVDPATGKTVYSATGEPLDPATGLPLDIDG